MLGFPSVHTSPLNSFLFLPICLQNPASEVPGRQYTVSALGLRWLRVQDLAIRVESAGRQSVLPRTAVSP